MGVEAIFLPLMLAVVMIGALAASSLLRDLKCGEAKLGAIHLGTRQTERTRFWSAIGFKAGLAVVTLGYGLLWVFWPFFEGLSLLPSP